ncbi:invasion associated locus B family protein [Mesorhizobium sp. BH1-1-4]|uniref:invasion associated locus B family protein n=1 Tax=Mesorhizobium sp. BH1-1-4 TaxID=2876662 RepID=UPI001CD179CE|nr:invasion associated locus B family protein [Mesorhizobium sp. BH1-1-4]MBZ9993120.1 invasion associated locus B family protein [Mesorhizobium sp. BH1-1-4]
MRGLATTALACLLLPGSLLAAVGQEQAHSSRIRPPEIPLPPDATLGDFQRIIRPFENWTLICDQTIRAHKKVCNVLQIVDDASGKMAFSWSLAGTEDGKPYMILRTAPNAKADGLISFKFQGRDQPVDVHLDGCNEAVCVGMMPVGPLMRRQISQSASLTVSYPTRDGKTTAVTATLKGLSAAFSSIN